ncbi:Uncharacterised protein [Chryseobacterium indoltheticum]|uniref:Uncharacterized protein n=1 Tax=Chryseobacterium indoltheticum TaxID=254 RepID=A0A381FQ93_9FLAO|nr:Uncharacterised protein [Chryseobacterium indoltheticum]
MVYKIRQIFLYKVLDNNFHPLFSPSPSDSNFHQPFFQIPLDNIFHLLFFPNLLDNNFHQPFFQIPLDNIFHPLFFPNFLDRNFRPLFFLLLQNYIYLFICVFTIVNFEYKYFICSFINCRSFFEI